MASTLHPRPPSIEDPSVEKLRSLVANLKKKYGEAISQLHAREHSGSEAEVELARLKESTKDLSQKFHESILELSQLRRERDQERGLIQEAHLHRDSFQEEIAALRKQHEELTTSLDHAREEAKRAHDDLAAIKLKESQLERVIQFLRKRSEEVHLESNQITQEFSGLQDSLQRTEEEQRLKDEKIRGLEKENSELKKDRLATDEELTNLREQWTTLRAQLTQEEATKNELSEQLSLELGHLNQKERQLAELLKEHQLLKELAMSSLEEIKNQLSQKEATHQASKALLQQDYESKLLQKENDLQSLREALAEELAKVSAHQSVAHQFENFAEEKSLLEKTVEAQKLALEESRQRESDLDQKFKTAQHHLAKKVRETSTLARRVEEQESQILSLQKEGRTLKEDLQHTKESLAASLENQIRYSEKEGELKRLYEDQLSRIETKYMEAYERLQRKEQELKELRSIEERFRQMELFFLRPNPPLIERDSSPPTIDLTEKSPQKPWMDQPSFL